LQREQEVLRTQAAELGWHDEDAAALTARIPGRTAVGVVRNLLNQRSGLISDVTNRTSQASGMPRSSVASLSPLGCRPSRIACVTSGASRVRVSILAT